MLEGYIQVLVFLVSFLGFCLCTSLYYNWLLIYVGKLAHLIFIKLHESYQDGYRQPRNEYAYIIPITVAVFNLSTVAFTPAHLFSTLLGGMLDRFVAISLAYAMYKTNVCFIDCWEERYAKLRLVYQIVNNFLVFYIHTYHIYLQFFIFSAVFLGMRMFMEINRS